jgi:hypothetical protein
MFSPSGSMAATRVDATATSLSDGRVLIAGGYNNSGSPGPVASAELYDPKTGTFSPTGSMTTARDNHTATLLSDGRVLMAGGDAGLAGIPGAETLVSAELYDPKTGTFSATGSMAAARYDHTATLLPDGRILIAGGVDADHRAYLTSAEMYDPASGKFSPTGSTAEARVVSAATLLSDGRVLVAGGFDGSSYVASAELYDPKTGAFSQTGSMTAARTGSATLLSDGRVLVAGGYDGSADLASAELYQP